MAPNTCVSSVPFFWIASVVADGMSRRRRLPSSRTMTPEGEVCWTCASNFNAVNASRAASPRGGPTFHSRRANLPISCRSAISRWISESRVW